MRKNIFIFLIILTSMILFISVSWSKGPTHPSINTFGHSTPGNNDTSAAWFQFMNEHIDWQTSGKDWYYPHYTRNQPIGAYWNIHHIVDRGTDYYNIKSWFESRGYHFENALAHWNDNTAQTFEGKTYFRPGWDWANDSNSDRIRDYPSDYASQDEFVVGNNWVHHPGRSWTVNQWQGDYLRLGWYDNGDTVSFIVTRNSLDTLHVSGTIPSHNYVYYLADDINAPNHNAVAQAESLAHILVYFTSQIATNITHPEMKHWGAHDCAELLREKRPYYSGPLAIFHDNIWYDLPGSKMGRAGYASVPHFGGTMLETGLQTDFHNHFKNSLAEIKDSITQFVSGQTYLVGNVGNYSDEMFDTLLRRCDGVWYERWTGVDQPIGKFNIHKETVERHQAMGKYTFLNMCGDGDLIGLEDRDKIFSLASYYITYDDRSYYLFDTSPNYGVRLADTTKWWFGLMGVDIGVPLAPAYTIYSGSIWRRDFSKGIVFFKPRPGNSSNYTDAVLINLGGYYYRLDSEGRKSPADSVNQVYIMNAEGIILLNTGEAQSLLFPPQPLSPQNGAIVDTTQPTLIIRNTQDPENRPLLYYFEIDKTEQFNSQSKKESTPFELDIEEESSTKWTVPTALSTGLYYWRSKAYTNTYPSDTSQFSMIYQFRVFTGEEDPLSNSPNLLSPHVFPNPYKLSGGDSYITFRDVPLNSKIIITTLSGELIHELSGNTSTDVVWDVKNKEGKDLASGVYYYLIDYSTGSTSGKLAIIR